MQEIGSNNASLASRLALLPETERRSILNELSPQQLIDLEYDWKFFARPNQLAPPGDWRTWLICAGRGFGKTRTGAEFVRQEVTGGRASRVALVGATSADARDVMVEGESGLLSVFPDHQRPMYEPSKRRVTFFNGAIATTFSADEPERLRGPQADLGWSDEVAAWRYPEAWDQLQFGLRLGKHPRNIVTTTPRPTALFRRIRHDASTVTTFGATRDNEANLADSFIREIYSKYAGTRLGRQELDGIELTDTPGALWTWGMIERARYMGALPEWTYRIVSIDPSVGDGTPGSDECGIVVCALGKDGFGYVLADRSLCGPPQQWGKVAVEAYKQFGCNWVIGEVNNGGKMIEGTIHAIDPTVPFREVRASKGKRIRAEPVSMLYEQGKCRHVGVFEQLESQLTEWSPQLSNDSPDRLDALVWGFTKLMVESAPGFFCGIA